MSDKPEHEYSMVEVALLGAAGTILGVAGVKLIPILMAALGSHGWVGGCGGL